VCGSKSPRMRDIATIDSELRLVAALSPCGLGAGWSAAVDRCGGRAAGRTLRPNGKLTG
jgi:hypothetical protein